MRALSSLPSPFLSAFLILVAAALHGQCFSSRPQRQVGRGWSPTRIHSSRNNYETGIALNWNSEKGYGFIKPNSGGDNLFCYYTAIEDGTFLREGAKVAFKRKPTPRGDNAVKVTGGALPDSTPCRSTVFVRGIPPPATEHDLRATLGSFGEIIEVSFPMQQTGLSDEMRHFGYAIVTFRNNEDAANALASDAGSDGRLLLDYNLTIEADKETSAGRERLLQQLKRCRSKEQVASIALQLGKPQDTREANKLIIAWGKRKEWQDAVCVFEAMCESGLTPDIKTYSAAISACGGSGEWQKALAFFEQMERCGIVPDVISFNAVIDACDKGRELDRALSLFNQMQGLGLEPDQATYTSAISACARGRLWEQALALLDEMVQQDIPANVLACSRAISGCGKASQWKRALMLLEEMRPRYGVKPNAISYSAAIKACMFSGEMVEAARVYRAAVADGIFLGSQPSNDLRRIDLHGLIWPVANIAVAELLSELKRVHCDSGAAEGSGRDNLKIITGRGEGSRDNDPVLKPHILEMLSLPEYASLQASEAADNPGLLVIQADALSTWLAEATSR